MVAKLDLSVDDMGTMFGIEMAAGADPGVSVAGVACRKCGGSGAFRSHAGRRVGNCFACAGTGVERAVMAHPGDCPKCGGSGEYSPGRSCFACEGSGQAAALRDTAVDASKIQRAFAAAMVNGIKRPRLHLDTFAFKRAPDTGRNAGSIYVTEDQTYLGKITAGVFEPTWACDDPTKDRVAKVAADPHAAAKAFGQRTGQCSCCGRELTNAESIALSIGPVCRDKYGWGIALAQHTMEGV